MIELVVIQTNLIEGKNTSKCYIEKPFSLIHMCHLYPGTEMYYLSIFRAYIQKKNLHNFGTNWDDGQRPILRNKS